MVVLISNNIKQSKNNKMKTLKRTSFISLIILFIGLTNAVAQNKVVVVKEKHPKNKVVVVKSKKHRVGKAKVYRPRWALRASFKHRWVYFPRHNFYWDNFRNVYVIRTGTVWVTSENAPKEVETVDLSKEECIELNEENDTQETIQDRNDEHQTEYKVK